MFIRMIVFLYVTEIQLDSETDEYKMTKGCYVFTVGRGLRLREEAMVLCFTEIELCFRDIYEKGKKKRKCYYMYGSYR